MVTKIEPASPATPPRAGLTYRPNVDVSDRGTEVVLVADLDLRQATGKYALESIEHPRFLAPHWREMVRTVRRQAKQAAKLGAE